MLSARHNGRVTVDISEANLPEQAAAIHQLMVRAGVPSYRRVALAIGLNNVSVGEYAKGERPLTYQAIERVVLLEPVIDFRDYWRERLRLAALGGASAKRAADLELPEGMTLGRRSAAAAAVQGPAGDTGAASAAGAAGVIRYSPGNVPVDRRREILALQDRLASETVRVPVVGRVHAGTPVMSESNIDDYLFVSHDLLRDDERERAFAVEVVGLSMEGDHFVPGELLIVVQQETAIDGQIVVALIDGEQICVKRYREGDPEHGVEPHLESHYADGSRPTIPLGRYAQILGRVVEKRQRFL